TMFLVDVDTPGVKITNVPRYTHTFVYEHPEFTFTDVQVGPEAVLGGVGAGLELTRDWFTEERLMIGARTIGAAERALTLAVDWARARVQGGEPLINRQLIQGMIADSVVDITTNRAYTHQVAWEFDQADALDPTSERRCTPRRPLSSSLHRRRPIEWSTGQCRSSAAVATFATTRWSGCGASCGSTGSGRAPPRSSGWSSPTRPTSGASRSCFPSVADANTAGTVDVRCHRGVAVITLRREHKRNALS